jgi:hypothetical protein
MDLFAGHLFVFLGLRMSAHREHRNRGIVNTEIGAS